MVRTIEPVRDQHEKKKHKNKTKKGALNDGSSLKKKKENGLEITKETINQLGGCRVYVPLEQAGCVLGGGEEEREI